jgi:hypothetical protein
MASAETQLQSEQTTNYHFDNRLSPSNVKILDSLRTREARNRIPINGKGPYKPGDEIQFNLQSNNAFLDRHNSYLRFKFRNQSTKDGSDFLYIPSDGGMVFNDHVEIMMGDQIVEKCEQGARYGEHLYLGTASQNHYNTELNALQKSYKYSTQNSASKKTHLVSDSNNPVSMSVPLDNTAFFRSSMYLPAYFPIDIRYKLPEAVKVMEYKGSGGQGGNDVIDYQLEEVEFMAEWVFPKEDIVKQYYNMMANNPTGLSFVLDGATDVYQRTLPKDQSEFNITLQVQYSNLQGLCMLVFPKTNGRNVDNITKCALPNLESYNVRFNSDDLSTRDGVIGLEEAYTNYRKMYGFLTDISGNGLMDYDTFKNTHTPLCINSELLPHVNPEVLNNALSTTAGGSQLEISLKLSSNLNDPHNIYIYTVHKRVVQIAERVVNVGI